MEYEIAGERRGGEIVDFLDTDEFQPRIVDKVERLLDLLEEMGRHPDLRGKLALHGGTAINLFMLDVPRLSVDIDVSYIGALNREDMQSERPVIERAIAEVGQALGYDARLSGEGHAGSTLVLRYRGEWGVDHVKVDCVYLNRSPLVKPTIRSCPLQPSAGVLVFDDVELAGGKVKAFFDRVKVRDLYDISNLGRHFELIEDEQEARMHCSLLYHASLSARFPLPFEGRSRRFADRRSEFEDQLLPMLRRGGDRPTLTDLMRDGESFVERYVLPRTDVEREYLERFAAGEFRPVLVFPDEAMADAASRSPEALWKLRNLRKM